MSHGVSPDLRQRMAELRDLGAIALLLAWDQETQMPPGGAEARARQLAVAQGLYHERLTDPRLGELLERAGEDPAARNLRRDRERAVRVPGRLVRELAERKTISAEVWRAARRDDDFASFRPHLERLIALRQEQADAIGHDGERYDALLEQHEPGMRVARLEPILLRLQAALVPIVDALTAAPPPPAWEPAGRSFPVAAQRELTREILGDLGFDLERGRQDVSTHPFCEGLAPGDVRLTTAYDEGTPLRALFVVLHEGGHGIYEQNLPLEHEGDFIGRAASMGLHESQSRFWENMIGRSRAFMPRARAALARRFPEAFGGVSDDALHAAVNRVRRSLIRVQADEVTYNLHILVRVRLELAMLRGDLPVADLPGAWNDAMAATVGVRPPDDRTGVLQDMHWAYCELGYFPTYTIGNLYAAVLHGAMDRELGGVDAAVRAGELGRIGGWLAERVHRHGHRWDAEEIVQRAAGTGLDERPFLDYLRGKYGPLYDVSV